MNGFGGRGLIAQRAVRPDGVVLSSPAFDEHLGLPERVEDFTLQQFVAELAVERFDVADAKLLMSRKKSF